MVNFATEPVREYSKSKQLASKRLIICTNCMCEFEKYEKQVSKSNFCSRKCYQDYHKKKKPLVNPRNPDFVYKNGRPYTFVKCDECGQQLLRRTDSINQRGTGNLCKGCVPKVSSRKNKGNTYIKKTGSNVSCEICKKEIYVCRHKVSTRRFCSKNCQHQWHRENDDMTKFISTTLKGESHPRYKHGKRVGKHESKPKLRIKIRERDGDWCLFCGKPGPGLHLHRVIYGSQGGKYEEHNCVLLCGEHHGLVHTNKKKWQPLLLQHLSDPSIKVSWLDENIDGIRYKKQLRD
jgi:hypothetical protein